MSEAKHRQKILGEAYGTKLPLSSLPIVGGLFFLGTVWGAPARAGALGFNSSQGSLRLNQIQSIGTHNSYHIQPLAGVKTLLETNPNSATLAKTLEYTHVPLYEQFEFQGIRQIELDIFSDTLGGLYAQPLGLELAKQNGLPTGPNFDPTGVMNNPGLKVLHLQDLDFRSTCLTFISCLQEVETWSKVNPEHSPIMILVEAKDEPLPPSLGLPFTIPLPFDVAALNSIEEEIRSVFSEDQLLTPDDVRGTFSTLNEAILTQGWPTLAETKGQVMFALDNGGPLRDLYLENHPSLSERLLFTDSRVGTPEAAFLKRNNPFDPEIPQLVSQGYLVRTRADADTIEARLNAPIRRDAAFASGAQFISTDYPVPNPDFSDYSVFFPERTTIRCNPINSPENCNFSSAAIAEPSSVLGLLVLGTLSLVSELKLQSTENSWGGKS